ncbi:hypothetical protein PHLCEN_2v4888 [Hermanssonia centrifuga]|uniref:tRNA-splicing endonuclease subunit Sen2 n=1 Tax=Hermanssonia centrifuga TaxID=98765 RepID=A0A2R6PGR1_9APHY|nr:hypothetical protein PHLCEN_2v4888 [Hermanssonia centrifuga]
MSLTTPNNRRGAHNKGGIRRNENNKIYGHPLPLIFSEPSNVKYYSPHRALGLFGISSARLETPHCEGILDTATHSVWIMNSGDAMILWRRGFFGKGDLSRSEPSWYTRQANARQAAGKYLTSEEIREKRRAERKQFKLDRARAIAEAAAEAEAAFAEGREAPAIAIPSGATWKPQSSMSDGHETGLPPQIDNGDEDFAEEEPLEDVEHLQLTLQEAFFLLWNLNCLTVLDPATNDPIDLKGIWFAFQKAYYPPALPASIYQSYACRFDNPFLVNYVAYHHYRSLGWVVKGGIKFCVDYLLYKRGPVFQHAE